MRRNDSSRTCGIVSRCTDERGAALIIVLAMLLLLSILGATMLSSTTSDLKIAGNYRNSTEAFYTADAAVAFAQTYDQIYLSTYVTSSTWPDNSGSNVGQKLDPTDFHSTAANDSNGGLNPDYKKYNRITIPGTNDKADVQVTLQGSGKLPAGLGTQEDAGVSPGGTGFSANNFVMNIIAYGPNNSTAQIESQLARIVQQ
jgi:Tfp pilus assembly protein PilX